MGLYFSPPLLSSHPNHIYLNLITKEIFNKNILFKEEKFGRCILDNGKIRHLEITKDIEEVIIKQVDSLDDDRKILELISCFGGSIKYHILKALVNTSEDYYKAIVLDKSYLYL